MKKILTSFILFLLGTSLSTMARIISQQDPIQESNPISLNEHPPGINIHGPSSLNGKEGVSFYMGFNVGYANHQYNYTQNLNGTGVTLNPSNDTATLGVFAGVQALIEDLMLEVEGIYIFDKSKNYSDLNNVGGVSRANTTLTSNHIWGAAFHAGLQIMPSLIPYISLGYRQQRMRLKAIVNNGNLGINQAPIFRAFVPGIGINYRMNEHLSFRIQYDEVIYDKKIMAVNNPVPIGPEIETIKPRVRTLSLGMACHF